MNTLAIAPLMSTCSVCSKQFPKRSSVIFGDRSGRLQEHIVACSGTCRERAHGRIATLEAVPNTTDRIRKLVEQGYTTKQIAATLGMSASWIKTIRYCMGISAKHGGARLGTGPKKRRQCQEVESW